MLRIGRGDISAPAKVVDLNIDLIESSADVEISVDGYRSLWCLQREGGLPTSISFWDVEQRQSIMQQELVDALAGDLGTDDDVAAAVSLSASSTQCNMTVVICTRDRSDELRRAIHSLTLQSDPNFEILVVDNAPSSAATATVVSGFEIPNLTYVVEPTKGLSRARNTALAHVVTDYVAWMDDDEVADIEWIRSLKQGFEHPQSPVAVCGLMLPAELETEAQVRFEQYGGFNKGRGIFAESLTAQSPSVVSPLYPLPAIGSGGNMAFRMDALNSAGGFDDYLGPGTRTRNGEETKMFASLLRTGHVILHWPKAITWHYHRREMSELHAQLFGYGSGLTAFYASTVRWEPSALFEILRLGPHALRDLGIRKGGLRQEQLPADFPKTLLSAGRRGMLSGAFSYAREMIDGSSRWHRTSDVNLRD